MNFMRLTHPQTWTFTRPRVKHVRVIFLNRLINGQAWWHDNFLIGCSKLYIWWEKDGINVYVCFASLAFESVCVWRVIEQSSYDCHDLMQHFNMYETTSISRLHKLKISSLSTKEWFHTIPKSMGLYKLVMGLGV